MQSNFVRFILTVSLLCPCLYGQSAGLQAAGQQPLPGRRFTIEEAVGGCKSAAVARLVSIGERDVGPPGASWYGAAEWETLEPLRGGYPRKAVLSLTVQSSPEKSRERLPEEGGTYIVMSYERNSRQIKKVLEYTAENLNKVKALLSKRGPS